MSPAAFLTPALSTLRDEIDARSPNRSTASDGWLGDAAHAARHSDHNPEADGSVDAIDVTHDPANGVDCYLLADEIKDDPRLKDGGYLIFDHRIWDPDEERWEDYHGENSHEHHLHVSVADRLQNDTSPWLEEEGFTDMDISNLIDAVKANTTAVNEAKKSNIRQHQKDRKNAVHLAEAEGRIEKAVAVKIVAAIDAEHD